MTMQDPVSLIFALQDPNPKTRGQAAEAMGKLGSTMVVEPLITALHDENADVRQKAAEALGKLDAPEAIPALEALEGQTTPVSRTVQTALEKLRRNAQLIEILGSQETADSGNIQGVPCPNCQTRTPTQTAYCRSCGYEFATGKEGAGGFYFAFPDQERAYIPSGKGSLRATTLMLVAGLGVAITGG